MKISSTGFISAFPGTGKSSVHGNTRTNGLYAVRADGTSLFRHMPKENQTFVYDSDSSTFDKSEFPQNYISHMNDVINRHKKNGHPFLFLCSSHDTVRNAMQKEGIPYTLIYPRRDLKAEYIERYKNVEGPQAFIDLMDANWDKFIDSCENDPNDKVVLGPGAFLAKRMEESK